MKHLCALGVLAVALAACGGDNGVRVTTAASSATETLAPTPEPESPTPSPAAGPQALAPEVTINHLGDTLMVRIDNPNESVGLIRAAFDLTLLAEDGAVIDTIASARGVPGAACCTIYHLPPGGVYGLTYRMSPDARRIHAVELEVIDEWVAWSPIDAPAVELLDVSVNTDNLDGPRLTGWAAVPSAATEGPFNVWVVGIIDSPTGLIVASGPIECVRTPEPRAFDIDPFAIQAQGPYQVLEASAYTTTVPGVTGPPPGC